MNDYKPVDCELYSLYETAIMQRQRLRAVWRDGNDQLCLQVLLPFDIKTFEQAEYLLAHRSDGRLLELRLDRIIRVVPIDTSALEIVLN